jgi:hypothetical protein
MHYLCRLFAILLIPLALLKGINFYLLFIYDDFEILTLNFYHAIQKLVEGLEFTEAEAEVAMFYI